MRYLKVYLLPLQYGKHQKRGFMTESQRMVEALKQQLRAHKVSYAQVAEALNLSEPSIKRCFAKCNFTLDRLEAICALIKLSLSDLARLCEEKPTPITRLTLAQEKELTNDERLLLVTFLVLNYWEIEEIHAYYHMECSEIESKLLRLDRLGMIALLPGNRVKLLTARHFSWHPNGPVRRYIDKHLTNDFFADPFEDKTTHKRFVGGLISPASLDKMHQHIDELTAKLDGYVRQDRKMGLEEKTGIAAVFAIRPWEIPAFRKLRREGM
jgi:hypothetical protein